jgi:hypothetical protein
MMAKTEHAGLKTRCPSCEAIVTIPGSGAGTASGVVVKRSRPGGPPPLDGPSSPPPRSRGRRRDEDDFDDPDDFDEERPRRKGKRNVKKRSMLPWVLLGVGSLLLLGGGAFGLWFALRSGGGSDDLALVPGDAQIFAHMRIADMMNTEPGRKSLADAQAGPGAAALADLKAKTGLEVTDIDRVTFAGADMDAKQFWVVGTFKKPVDRQKIYSTLQGVRREEGTHEGKKYDVFVKGFGGPDDRIGVYWLNDKTVVGGTEVGVKRCITLINGKRPAGTMDEVINRAAKEKHSMVFGVVPPPAFGNALGGGGFGPPGLGGPGLEGLQALKDIKVFTFVLDYDTTMRLELGARMGSDATAQKAKTSLDGLIATGKTLLPLFKKEFTKGLPPQVGEQVYTAAKSTLDAIKVNQTGPSLTVQASFDTKTIENAMAGMAPQFMGGLPLGGGGFGPPVGGGGFGPPPGGGFGPGVAAQRMQHSNNLKQIVLAMHNYADSHRGQFPPAVIYSADGRPLYSWRVELLPYLEADQLYKKFNKNESWDSPHNRALLSQMPKCFAMPGSGPGETRTCYQVFVGANTPWPNNGRTGPRMPADFPDGTSNTVLVAEAANLVEWSKPDDMNLLPGLTPKQLLGQKVDPGKFAVALADGSVRMVPATISDQTLNNAVNPKDGMPLGADWPQR